MDSLEARPWNPARQCTAANREGERCRRQPIPGGTVCVMHGGSIPAVQAAAKLRLLAMVEPILSVFEEIVATWRGERCEACGRPTGDPAPVIRIGQLVLDRSGFHPTLSIEHAPPPPDEYEGLEEGEMIEAMQAKLDRCQQMLDLTRRNRDSRLLPEAEEGFIVPEDAEPASLTEPIHDEGVQFPLGNLTADESKDSK